MLTLNPQSPTTLVAQIVTGLERLCQDGTLRAGAKLPSVRRFAATHQVSVFTVVEAYDRLVAQGWLTARPHQGFFIQHRPIDAKGSPPRAEGLSFDSAWYLKKIFENRELALKPGCGWIPQAWLFNDGVKRALRQLGSDEVGLAGYGDPKGYAPLRRLVSQRLMAQEIALQEDQVLLTQGSTQALDLAARQWVRPGDPVLVDDPGYANVLLMLRLQGARLIPVPRTPTGYDLAALEAAILAHQPRVFFTQPRLQSPTGSSASLAQMHRLLQLADRHDLIIVENDIYADLDVEARASLASLDQLQRVVHITSYSKTISPNIRVGHVTAHRDRIDELTLMKMASGLTSSELNERLTHAVLTDPRWRRHLKNLRERLIQAQHRTAARLSDLGFKLFTQPGCGMYLWACHPDICDSAQTAERAAEHNIMLGPGHLFMPDRSPTPWFRFNVAFCDDERIFEFLNSSRRRPTSE